MTELDLDELTARAETLVSQARAKGADVAEAQATRGWELSTRVRLGEVELLSESGHSSAYLRVIRDGRVALTSTSDTSAAGLERSVLDAMELLEISERDEFAGPADGPFAAPPFRDLQLFDPEVANLDAKRAIELAQGLEAAALSSDERLRYSEGANVGRVSGASALVLSGGFSATKIGSYASLSVAPVAVDEAGKRHRGSYYSARRYLSDLLEPADIGKEAARRALRQLGARKVATTTAPVIFESDVARSLVGTFAQCICGGALWRKSSYLLDRLGTRVAGDMVTFVDDPWLLRGPGSRAFDGEGLPSRTQAVVEGGILQTYLLDSYSARKLGSVSTHSASRGGANVSASTSNFYMSAGEESLASLIARTEKGLYVTDMMGFGFNPVTGDFSRGATGLWIENGELTHPVSEVTISGNLDQMLKDIDGVADDLDHQTSTASPSFRISSMTISGS